MPSPFHTPMPHTTQLIVLLAHGSRQPEWARPFEIVRDSVQATHPDLPVRLAFLESMQPALRQVLEEAGRDGLGLVRVAPLFLGSGGHLQRDIPNIARDVQALYPALQIELATPAGEDGEVLAALAAYAVRCASGLDG